MATSLKIVAGNLEARLQGVKKDAQAAQTQAIGLGSGIVGVEEVRLATKIIIDAVDKASKYLLKAERGR